MDELKILKKSMDSKLHSWSILTRVAMCLIFLAVVQQGSGAEVSPVMQFIVTGLVGFNAIFLVRVFRAEDAINPLHHRYIYVAVGLSLYAWMPTLHAPSVIFRNSWSSYSCWSLAAVMATFLLDHAYVSALKLRRIRGLLRYYCQRIEDRWKVEAQQGDGNSQLELVELHLNRLGNYDLLKADKPQADRLAINWLRMASKNPDKWTQEETLNMIEKAKLIIGESEVEYWLSQEE